MSNEECAYLCSREPECASFELGVNHGSQSPDAFSVGDCLLKSSANSFGCFGGLFNKDLYVKSTFPSFFFVAKNIRLNVYCNFLCKIPPTNDASQKLDPKFW